MKKNKFGIISIILGSILAVVIIFTITSCSRLTPFFNTATTNMTSSNLSGLSANSITNPEISKRLFPASGHWVIVVAGVALAMWNGATAPGRGQD